jgi:hypothetical protein
MDVHGTKPTTLLTFVLTQTSHEGLASLFHHCMQANKHVQYTCLLKRLSLHPIACNVVVLIKGDERQLVCPGQPRQLSLGLRTWLRPVAAVWHAILRAQSLARLVLKA